MALFNRKKEDAPAPAASGTEQKPLTNEAFDFDAISRDLDAQNGASSFDSLLAAPATPAQPATTKEADSAFDFPQNDPLGLSSSSVNPPTHPAMAAVTTPDTVLNAPLATPAMPSTGVAPLEPAPVVPTGVTQLKGKKAMPLIPILGALGLLAVVGGGAMFFLNSNKEAPEPETSAPAVTRPNPAQNSAAVSSSQPAPETAASVPATGLRSASPGIAPPRVATTPAKGTSNVPVSVAQSPARPATSAAPPAGVTTPAVAAQLKVLWKQGADAKHRNDFEGARKAWTEALRLAPNHPGFADSIKQLHR